MGELTGSMGDTQRRSSDESSVTCVVDEAAGGLVPGGPEPLEDAAEQLETTTANAAANATERTLIDHAFLLSWSGKSSRHMPPIRHLSAHDAAS